MEKDFKLDEELTADELAAQEADEKFILEFKEEDMSDPDKAKELNDRLARAKTTIHQKKHYREKVQTLSEELKTKGGSGDPVPPPKKDDADKQAELIEKEATNKRLTITELKSEGWSKDEAEEIYNAAKSMGLSVEKALESTVFQPFLDKLKVKKEAEGASFAPRSRGAGPAASDKIDWSKATADDVRKHGESVRRAGHR